MGIRSDLGFFIDRANFVSHGPTRSTLGFFAEPTTEAFLRDPASGIGKAGVPDHKPAFLPTVPFDIRTRITPSEPEDISEYVNMGAYIKAFIQTYQTLGGSIYPLLREQDSITATIECAFFPLSTLNATIFSWYRQQDATLKALIVGATSTYSNLNAFMHGYEVNDFTGTVIPWYRCLTSELVFSVKGIGNTVDNIRGIVKGIKSTHTQPHEYHNFVVTTQNGLVLFRRLFTNLPDLKASIHSFQTNDLTVDLHIVYRDHSDYKGIIKGIGSDLSTIISYINPMYTSTINGSLVAINSINLYGSLYTIQAEQLPAYLQTIPFKFLTAFCGGHLPSNLTATILSHLPVDLFSMIRVVTSSYVNLAAEIVSQGDYRNLKATLIPSFKGNSFIEAYLKVLEWKVLSASVHGWDTEDLTADIYSLYFRDLSSLIYGKSYGNIINLPGVIYPYASDITTLQSNIKGWFSTHTTSYLPNKDLYSFPRKKFIIGVKNGINIFKTPIVYGVMPDLKAMIFALPLNISYLYAYITPFLASDASLNANVQATTSKVIHNRLQIDLVNLSILKAYISAYSKYVPLTAVILGWKSTSTDIGAGSLWTESLVLNNIFLSTNRGLFLYSGVAKPRVIRTFINTSTTPDLVGWLHGWDYADLFSTINIYPKVDLNGYVFGKSLDELVDINARIHSFKVASLLAEINSVGSMLDLAGSLVPQGSCRRLTAKIYPMYSSGGSLFLGVSTIPYENLYATINYTPYSGGKIFGSRAEHINAFINTKNSFNTDFTATIYSRTFTSGLFGYIRGLNKIQPNVLNIFMTPGIFSFGNIRSSIFCFTNSISDLPCFIQTDHFKQDLNASITVQRYPFGFREQLSALEIYRIVNMNGVLEKELKLLFGDIVPAYIYDSLSNSVYKNNRSRWTIDVVSVIRDTSFFDKVDSNSVSVDSLSSYNSIDEAIRAAIDLMSTGRYAALAASITPSGGYITLNSYIVPTQKDQESFLYGKIMPVFEVPFLYASIYTLSRITNLFSFVKGVCSDFGDFEASLKPVRFDSVTATITPQAL